MTLPSDVMRAPSDREAVAALRAGGFAAEIDEPIQHRHRVIKSIWRNKWIVWDEKTPLPERARGQGGQRIACQYVWVVELQEVHGIRFRFTGEEWHDEDSPAGEVNIMLAMFKAHARYTLEPDGIVWPAGWWPVDADGRGLSVMEVNQLTTARFHAAEAAA